MTRPRAAVLLYLVAVCLPLLFVAPALADGPPLSVSLDYPLDRGFSATTHAPTITLDTSEFQDGLPTKVDYSKWATFKRCQNWGGGCQCYAVLHILDILKEWEHPYTPDLSWRYVLNTFQDRVEQDVQAGEISNIHQIPDLLSWVFEEGVAPEALCRSEMDLLTGVVRGTTHTLYDPKYPGAIQDYTPGPDTAAIAEAPVYRGSVSDPYIPEVQKLRAMLHHYGPIWSAGHGHARAIVGYDDDAREFIILDSSGDWQWANGFRRLGYDDLTAKIESLRVVTNTSTPRLGDYHAYSARIRITGVWRGSHTVSVGVQGREFLEVWRTHGRKCKQPFEFGGTLEIDVPLPSYAPDCWPPSATNRWVLRVADNDRDGRTGDIREFTLARRLVMPNCESMGRLRTETFGGAMNVACQDPTTGPQVPRHWAGNNFFAGDWHDPNPNPGVVEVLVPEPGVMPLLQRKTLGQYKVVMRPHDAEVGADHRPVFHGQLLARAHALQGWLPVAGEEVTVRRLDASGCINMPAKWELQGTHTTDAEGRFSFKLQEKPGLIKQYWAAGFKGPRDYFLASSEISEVGLDRLNVPVIHQMIEVELLPFPDLPMNIPRIGHRMLLTP